MKGGTERGGRRSLKAGEKGDGSSSAIVGNALSKKEKYQTLGLKC